MFKVVQIGLHVKRPSPRLCHVVYIHITHPKTFLGLTCPMDFMLGFQRIENGKNYILWLWDRFFRMTHFIQDNKLHDACLISNIFFEEVVRLLGLPRNIVSNRDIKFSNYFWIIFIEKRWN